MRRAAKSLVIVVGAGASNEAGLPIGVELKHQIASALDIRFENGQQISGDDYIPIAFHELSRHGIQPYINAARTIRDAMPQAASIDNFIDAHRGNGIIAECGKLAIARCILQAEAKSPMYVDTDNIYNKIKFKEFETTWFNSFFHLIVDNCQVKNIPDRLSRIAIITFNYDRCIEHYFHGALRNYYGIDSQTGNRVNGSFADTSPLRFSWSIALD